MVQLNETESKMFASFSEGAEGRILVGYFERLVADAVDIRNIEGTDIAAEIKARKLFADKIQESVINKLKSHMGQVTSEGTDEFH